LTVTVTPASIVGRGVPDAVADENARWEPLRLTSDAGASGGEDPSAWFRIDEIDGRNGIVPETVCDAVRTGILLS
jgi:hypothetical protein